MAKSKSSKPAAPEKITMHYDLMTLPTAQHRAGLAGLVLQVRLMQKKEKSLGTEKIPVIEKLTRTELTITFTELSLQEVFDELYAADPVEISRKKLIESKTLILKREDYITIPGKSPGELKREKRFVYEMPRPKGLLLINNLHGGESSPWLKLWRDMLWDIPYGNPQTRKPFKKRADNFNCDEGSDYWTKLTNHKKTKENTGPITQDITGAMLLSAQKHNAEKARFSGRLEDNLLLHFWKNVTIIFIPRILERDKKHKDKYSFQEHGFAICVPDVADLISFSEIFPEMLSQLTDSIKHWRPSDAFIDIPVQSNLEFLRYLTTLAAAVAEKKSWEAAVSHIESFHMKKTKKIVKLLGHSTVANNKEIISKYRLIRDNCKNPIFRRARLKNLLEGKTWYSNLLEVFAEQSWKFFVGHENTLLYEPRFRIDVRKQFQHIEANFKIMQDLNQTSAESESDRLSRIVHRLVKKYVQDRTLSKLAKKLEYYPRKEFKGKMLPVFNQEYIEKQQKVCSETFLAMRSRQEQEFVSYFVGSICSCPQFLKMDDYKFLTQILLRKSNTNPSASSPPCWEDVKALAMIACSAVTLVAQKSENATQGANA